MAAVHGRYTKFWVGRFDFSGDSNGLDTLLTAPTIDVTTFQSAGKDYVPGWPEMLIAQAGYITSVADNELEDITHTLLGSESNPGQVAALYGTQTPGCPAYVVPNALASGMQISTPVDGVLTITATWISGSGVERSRRGYRVADQAVNAVGPLAGVDFGASAGLGGTAYLFVRNFIGAAPAATINVESASGPAFGAPTVEGTFTFAAVGSSAIELDAVIAQHIRLNVTSMGGSSAFTIGAIVCVNGVTN